MVCFFQAKEATLRAERLRGEVVRGAEALQQQAAATEAAIAGQAAADVGRAEAEATLAVRGGRRRAPGFFFRAGHTCNTLTPKTTQREVHTYMV